MCLVETQPLFRISEVADQIGVSPSQIKRWIRNQTFPIPPYKYGRKEFWTEASIDAWLETIRTQRSIAFFAAPECEGRVYFIKCGGYVKIGWAVVPAKRLKELQTASPMVLELIHHMPGDLKKEHELHERFAHLRVRPNGEWFQLSEEIMNFIGGKESGNGVG